MDRQKVGQTYTLHRQRQVEDRQRDKYRQKGRDGQRQTNRQKGKLHSDSREEVTSPVRGRTWISRVPVMASVTDLDENKWRL